MSSNTIITKVYDYRDSSPFLFNDDYVEFGNVNTGLRNLVSEDVLTITKWYHVLNS